jgi:hypothetical protein
MMQIKEALLGGVLVCSGHHATGQVPFRRAIRLSLHLQNGHSRPDTGKGRKHHKADIFGKRFPFQIWLLCANNAHSVLGCLTFHMK